MTGVSKTNSTRSRLRGVLRWPAASKSRAGSVTIGAVGLTAALAAGLGVGYTASQPFLADGSADLARGHTVVHTNGISGASDAEVARSLATGKQRLETVRLPDGRVAIVNNDTGRVDLIDATTYEPHGQPEVHAESAGHKNLKVLAGASKSFLVDQKRGTVKEIGLDAKAANPVNVPGGIVEAVPVADSVWAVTNDAKVVEIVGNRVARQVSLPSGRPQLTVADGHAVVVIGAQSAYVVDGVVPRKIAETGLDTDAATDVVLGSWRGAGRHVLVVAREMGVLVAIDARTGSRSTVDLDVGSGAKLGAPIEFEGRVYVPDFAVPALWKVDIATRGATRLDVPGAPGEAFELKVSGGRVWANSQYDRRTLVVDSSGSSKTVDKGEDKDVIDSEAGPQSPPREEEKPTEQKPTTVPPPTPRPGPSSAKPKPRQPISAAEPPAAPGIPVGVLAQPGDAQALVSWGPANSNRSPVTRYLVSWTVVSGGNGTPGELAVPGNRLTVTVPNLGNGTTYRISVQAQNAIGRGPGADSPPVTPGSDTPGAPSDIRAVATSDGTVTAIWQAADGKGHQVARYDVTATGDDGSSTQVAQAPGTDTSVTLRVGEGLTVGVGYTFTVAAVNDRDTSGPASTSSNAVTPYQPAVAPGNFATSNGDGAVDLRWDQPDLRGGMLVHFVVAGDGISERTVTGTSARIDGLTNWTTPNFRVRAVTRARGSSGGPTVDGAEAATAGSPVLPNQPSRSGCSEGVAIRLTSGAAPAGARPPRVYVQGCSEVQGDGKVRGVIYFWSDETERDVYAETRAELHYCGRGGTGIASNPDSQSGRTYNSFNWSNRRIDLREQTWDAPVNEPTFTQARVQALRVTDSNGIQWTGDGTGSGWRPGCP